MGKGAVPDTGYRNMADLKTVDITSGNVSRRTVIWSTTDFITADFTNKILLAMAAYNDSFC